MDVPTFPNHFTKWFLFYMLLNDSPKIWLQKFEIFQHKKVWLTQKYLHSHMVSGIRVRRQRLSLTTPEFLQAHRNNSYRSVSTGVCQRQQPAAFLPLLRSTDSYTLSQNTNKFLFMVEPTLVNISEIPESYLQKLREKWLLPAFVPIIIIKLLLFP